MKQKAEIRLTLKLLSASSLLNLYKTITIIT